MKRLISIMLIGIILITWFAVPAMASDPYSVEEENVNCANLNADDSKYPSITSDYGFKIDGQPFGTNVFTLTTGTQHLINTQLSGGAPSDPDNSVTIIDSDGKIFDWTATITVDAVIVKAKDSNVYVYIPAASNDEGLNAPELKDISHIDFCYGSSLYPPPPPVPEFPTVALPVGMIIGSSR